VLYQARIHPEQYSNTFSDKEMDRIHNSIMTVCMTACDVLADSSKFPDDWLMRYRWGKGKSKENTLPNGHKITFITVGGRTSAVVASLQKKTGPVSDNAKVEEDDGASLLQSKKIPKLKTKAKKTIATKVVDDSSQSRRKSTRKVAPKAYTQEEIDSPVEQIVPERTAKRKMAASDESRSGFKRARK
jgi:formamidopyrimidine-DNA glycosylase